jgi:XTP/dITP diphosphohydrolase
LSEAGAPRLLIATSNPGKQLEYRQLLAEIRVEVVSPSEIGLDIQVDEDGVTFLANAQKKAHAYADASGLPVLADDSGLVIDALGGEPGVWSSTYGGEGLSAAERNFQVLEKMAGVAERRARFICVICLGAPGQPAYKVFVGECEGRIAREPRGSGGFGYDPIFVLPDGQTMAELDDAGKNTVSARGRAAKELLAQLDLKSWVGSAAAGARRG